MFNDLAQLYFETTTFLESVATWNAQLLTRNLYFIFYNPLFTTCNYSFTSQKSQRKFKHGKLYNIAMETHKTFKSFCLTL